MTPCPLCSRRVIDGFCCNPSCDYRETLAPIGRICYAGVMGERKFPPPRPQCQVAGCRDKCAEGGLCETHHAAWRSAGRPPRDAWSNRQGVA